MAIAYYSDMLGIGEVSHHNLFGYNDANSPFHFDANSMILYIAVPEFGAGTIIYGSPNSLDPPAVTCEPLKSILLQWREGRIVNFCDIANVYLRLMFALSEPSSVVPVFYDYTFAELYPDIDPYDKAYVRLDDYQTLGRFELQITWIENIASFRHQYQFIRTMYED
jgi:hypothetical protein